MARAFRLRAGDELDAPSAARYHLPMRTALCFLISTTLCSACLQQVRPLGGGAESDPRQGQDGGHSPSGDASPTPTPSSPSTPTPNPTLTPMANGNCADLNVLLCDSFETKPVGSAPDGNLWALKIASANDTVRVDNTRAHNGGQSLWVHTQTGSFEAADIVNKSVPAVAHSVIYGRAFIYLMTDLPSTHISLVTAGSPLPNNNYTWVRYGGQFGILMINYQPDTGTESWQHSDTPLALNQWVCIQFYYNGNTTEARFWIDDVEIPKLYLNQQSATIPQGAPAGVWSMPNIDTITLGWEHYPSDSGTDGMDIWYDDVVLDTNFIRCSP